MEAEDKGQGPLLQEEDILQAMGEVAGYLDITPRDFQVIYTLAYNHALARLRRELTARKIMTTRVEVVYPDTPVAQVAEVMGKAGISGVPVVERTGEVVGIISEKDFLRRMGVKDNQNFMTLVAACLRTKGCMAVPLKQQTARELMSAPAITVAPDTSLEEIINLFFSRHINRAPVTDDQGGLLGIVTRGDLLRALRGEG
jgi:CBS domain-containing membrane protein